MSSLPLMSTSYSSSSSSDESLQKPADVLNLGQSLSFAIKEKTLHIQDERRAKKQKRSCCSLSKGPQSVTTIPLYNIVNASVSDSQLNLSYASSAFKPTTLSFPYEPSIRSAVEKWTVNLLSLSYGPALPNKRLKILINPVGGPGSASSMFTKHCEPLLTAAGCTLAVESTTYSGHAVDIAEHISLTAHDAIVCVSGDGVPHEVFNGLAKRADAAHALASIAVCQLPGGSGNAMCWNLTGTDSPGPATLAIIKGVVQPMDLISITQGSKRFLSFLSQSLGAIADADLGTEHLRWMGGHRFAYGLLSRIWSQTVYPCDLAVKVEIESKEHIRAHYRTNLHTPLISTHPTNAPGLPPLRFGDINTPLPPDWELIHHPCMGNFYAGNMAWMSAAANFFPAACINDGLFDVICIDGTLPRAKALKVLLAVETGAHFEMEQVSYQKVVAYRIVPHRREGVDEEYISIDGERIEYAPFQAEVHTGLGRVLGSGGGYQAPGV